jgi:endonuclease III related protein
VNRNLLAIYERLFQAYGNQNWWPGLDPFEIAVGAILTQAVAWRNVEQALASLKSAELLSVEAISSVSLARLAEHIRPTVYYNQKAERLNSFSTFIKANYQGDLSNLFRLPVAEMRKQLLLVNGIGPETADSIIVYAAHKPSFVIDGYTRRIIKRLGLIDGDESYAFLRELFMKSIPLDEKLYNEYHALLVRHGKERCGLSSPACIDCPLRAMCTYSSTTR